MPVWNYNSTTRQVDGADLVGSDARDKSNWNALKEGVNAALSESASALSYISATQPAGAPAPVAVYQFDNSVSDLLDRTPNGHDLTLTLAGGVDYHTVVSGLVARQFDGNAHCIRSAYDAAFEIVGALTLEVLATVHDDDGECAFASYVGDRNSETEPNNFLYTIRALPASLRIQTVWENNGGINTDSAVAWGAGVVPGVLSLITLTRDGSGNANMYINGELIDGPVATTPPTISGSAGRFVVGAEGGAGTVGDEIRGAIASVRVTAAEYSAAHVLAAAQQVGLAIQ